MWHELSFLLPYLRRYRRTYVLGSLCIVSSIALKLLIPHLLGDSIDALRELAQAGAPSSGAGPAAAGPGAGGALLGGTAGGAAPLTGLVARSALVIALTAAGVALVRRLSRVLILGTSRRVVHDVRNVVFDHLLRLAPSFYVRNPIGQIMSRCVNDMQNVQGLMGPVIMYLAETTTLFAIGLTLMFRIEPRLTLISILPFPLVLYAARRLAVRIQTGSRRAQNALAELSAKVDESLSGQLVIKTLAIEGHDRERFLARCHDYRRLNLRVTRYRAILIPMMMGLTSLSTVIVLMAGGPLVVRGELSLGRLITMILYLQMLAGPTRTLGFIISALRRGASALGRIREILEAAPTIADPAQPVTGAITRGALRVDDLSVVYPPPAAGPHLSGGEPETDPRSLADPQAPAPESAVNLVEPAAAAAGGGAEPLAAAGGGPAEPAAAAGGNGNRGARRVLDGISFSVPAGSTLGIVGHVGAGKSTLVRAIARQLEVEPGHIDIDGTDITRIGLDELRRAIGFVPQDAFLFSASLADNIALGQPAAARAAIAAAAAGAGLDADLAQLPAGLDTVVGERGVNLSGGQRQRAALARVLLLSPRILILDDTLSAVDTHTADAILERLRPFAAGRTTLIVAHRLATVQHAGQILVLEEGRIVERGTHAELLELGGRYARLYARQQRTAARSAELQLAPEQLETGEDG